MSIDTDMLLILVSNLLSSLRIPPVFHETQRSHMLANGIETNVHVHVHLFSLIPLFSVCTCT